MSVGVAVTSASLFLFSPPVFALTNGSSALDVIDSYATPSEGLVSIPGGAGSGLATAGELSGAAVDVSGEIAGVASAGIAVTPVGWAIMGSLAVAAGGYYAWRNRGALLSAAQTVWSHLSSSQQSSLESSNSPGSSISVPLSALQSVLQNLSTPIASSAGLSSESVQVKVPQGWPQGAEFQIKLTPGAGSPQLGGTWSLSQSVWTPLVSGLGTVYNVANGSYPASGDGTGSKFGWGTLTYGDLYGGNDGQGYHSSVFKIPGLSSGSVVYVETQYDASGNNPGGFNSVAPMTSAGTPVQWGTVANGVTNISIPAVPAASSPPAQTPPKVSSSNPSFWPASYNPSTGTLNPPGVSAPNPLVNPNAPVANPLPSGTPSPGFVSWLESLVVPTSAQLAAAIGPLESSFSDRIPFSYVSGLLGFFPEWVDGVGSGGCASVGVPEFGFNGSSKNPGGATSSLAVCPGGFMGGAFGLLKAAMSVMLWAFLLGWGVMMFRRLLLQ